MLRTSLITGPASGNRVCSRDTLASRSAAPWSLKVVSCRYKDHTTHARNRSHGAFHSHINIAFPNQYLCRDNSTPVHPLGIQVPNQYLCRDNSTPVHPLGIQVPNQYLCGDNSTPVHPLGTQVPNQYLCGDNSNPGLTALHTAQPSRLVKRQSPSVQYLLQGSGGGSAGGVQRKSAGGSGTCHASGWPPRDLGWMPDWPKTVWPAATKPG